MQQNDMLSFADSIKNEAERQKKKIMAETRRSVEAQLKKAETDIKRKNLEYIGRETAKLLTESGYRISQKNIEAGNMLYTRRAEILDGVYSDVTEKLAEFAASEDYPEFLKKSAARCAELLNNDNIEFFVRPADEKFADCLKGICPSAEIFTDETIVFGGLKATDGAKRIMLDDTIDARFEEEKIKFRTYSGLAIEKEDEA